MKKQTHKHYGVKKSHKISIQHRNLKTQIAHNAEIRGNDKDYKDYSTKKIKSKTKEIVYIPIITNNNKYVRVDMDRLYEIRDELKDGVCVVNINDYKIRFTEQDLKSIMEALSDSGAREIGISLMLKE